MYTCSSPRIERSGVSQHTVVTAVLALEPARPKIENLTCTGGRCELFSTMWTAGFQQSTACARGERVPQIGRSCAQSYSRSDTYSSIKPARMTAVPIYTTEAYLYLFTNYTSWCDSRSDLSRPQQSQARGGGSAPRLPFPYNRVVHNPCAIRSQAVQALLYHTRLQCAAVSEQLLLRCVLSLKRQNIQNVQYNTRTAVQISSSNAKLAAESRLVSGTLALSPSAEGAPVLDLVRTGGDAIDARCPEPMAPVIVLATLAVALPSACAPAPLSATCCFLCGTPDQPVCHQHISSIDISGPHVLTPNHNKDHDFVYHVKSWSLNHTSPILFPLYSLCSHRSPWWFSRLPTKVV